MLIFAFYFWNNCAFREDSDAEDEHACRNQNIFAFLLWWLGFEGCSSSSSVLLLGCGFPPWIGIILRCLAARIIDISLHKCWNYMEEKFKKFGRLLFRTSLLISCSVAFWRPTEVRLILKIRSFEIFLGLHHQSKFWRNFVRCSIHTHTIFIAQSVERWLLINISSKLVESRLAFTFVSYRDAILLKSCTFAV